jgi:DUF4097 and DUF4098 domain-containing protein YvlB
VFNSHKTLIVVVVLLIALSLACNASVGISPYTAEETVTQSFEVGEPPHVVVETFNGKIEVTTDSSNTVQASVTKRGAGASQSAAQDDLKNVQVTMTEESGTIRIVARRTLQNSTWGNSGAWATLKVPNGTSLELRSSNGSVTVTGPTGDVTVNTSNGKIQIAGSQGRLQLDTSNGAIDVSATNALVTAHTSNGAITFRGDLAQGDHSFRTSNGRITLTLPSNASFTIDAQTSNGKITSDFAVSRTSGSRDTELRGTVGQNPTTSVTLRTSNGGIEIQQSK